MNLELCVMFVSEVVTLGEVGVVHGRLDERFVTTTGRRQVFVWTVPGQERVIQTIFLIPTGSTNDLSWFDHRIIF